MSTIAIAMPLVEAMYSRFFERWLTLELPPPSQLPRHVEVGGAITDARNRCVRWFLEETDAERLLFLDQDHPFPVNLLERVANYVEPVVGALYYGRHEPYHPIAIVPHPRWDGGDGVMVKNLWQLPSIWRGEGWEADKLTYLWPGLESAWRQEGALNQVLAVGAGCMAIRRDVLTGWPQGRPWFTFETTGAGQAVGEDVYFCREARRAGHDVFLDSGVVLPHLTVRSITHADYIAHLRRRATEAGIPGPL